MSYFDKFAFGLIQSLVLEIKHEGPRKQRTRSLTYVSTMDLKSNYYSVSVANHRISTSANKTGDYTDLYTNYMIAHTNCTHELQQTSTKYAIGLYPCQYALPTLIQHERSHWFCTNKSKAFDRRIMRRSRIIRASQ